MNVLFNGLARLHSKAMQDSNGYVGYVEFDVGVYVFVSTAATLVV